MAYYLLRDRPATTYADFDVPESLALASYYLLKSFPQLKFLLYGEEEFSERSLTKFDVVLMPPFELDKLQAKGVDLTFSSHTLLSLSSQAIVEYMDEIARATRGFFLHVSIGTEAISLQRLMGLRYPSLVLTEERRLEWNSQKFPDAVDAECLYKVVVV